MKNPLLLLTLGALAALPVALSAKIVRTEDRTFPVQPGGLLKVSTQGGDIVVKTADIDEVRITVRKVINAPTEREADGLLEPLMLKIGQSDGGVTAEARYEKKSTGGWFKNWPPVQVDFLVTVPSRYHTDLKTSGGDVEVGSLTGNVRIHTSGGDVRLERIDGEVEAGTSGGDITLREGTARARVHTSGGDIRIERAGGPVEAGTSGGDIIINSAEKIVRAHTSGGDIRAVLTAPLDADCSLGTSGGDVSVRFPKSAAFQLDASTSGGDVDATGLTITIEKGGLRKSRLAGAVNGGGPTLRLRSSGGDIKLRGE